MTPLETAELRQLLIIAWKKKQVRVRDASCTGKQAFPTFDAAKITLRRHRDGILKPYRCRECNAWHIAGNNDHKKRAYDYTRERGIE